MGESLTLSSMMTGASAGILGSGSGLGTQRKETSLAPILLNLSELREMLRRMLPKFVSARTKRLYFFLLESSPPSSDGRGLMNRLPVCREEKFSRG